MKPRGSQNHHVPALLFASWMPTSKAGFVLSCLAIMLAAACEVMLRKIAVRVERRLMRSRQPVLRRNAQRAALTFFSSTLSYAIMLLAMTFDVYIFFSIMVGFALGTLIAGQLLDPEGNPAPFTMIEVRDATDWLYGATLSDGDGFFEVRISQ